MTDAYDPADPRSDRRVIHPDQLALLAGEVHRLTARPVWVRYGPALAFVVSLVGLVLTGYGGYAVLESTVTRHSVSIDQRVTASELQLQLQIRDARIDSVQRSQQSSTNRLDRQLGAINQKLDKLIDRQLDKRGG